MNKLINQQDRYINSERVYLQHGEGVQTQVVLGTASMLRTLKLKGLPDVKAFEWHAQVFDCNGQLVASFDKTTKPDEEVLFDSNEILRGKELKKKIEGSLLLTVKEIQFAAELPQPVDLSRQNFNGVVFIHRPGSFVTGVHMYHGTGFYSAGAVLKFYSQAAYWRLLSIANRIRISIFSSSRARAEAVWTGDAIGASVAHSTPDRGGRGIYVIHADNAYPGLFGFMEFRSQKNRHRRERIAALKANSTLKAPVPVLDAKAEGGEGWNQILCVPPPMHLSRFLTGEEFSDGRICVDHTYFQQPKQSLWSKEGETRFFPRSLLRDGVIGPSNPWPLVHSEKTESLFAASNQFHPDEVRIYDLHVFDENGKRVLFKQDFITLEPYGLKVVNVSEELRKIGITYLDGTYLFSHSANSPYEMLPGRIHCQAVYRFDGEYWNGVQSDSSIWSSPNPPIPEIENLSYAKVRRRQLWYAPVIESESLESIIALANLSYTLNYKESQTLFIRLSRGGNLISEKEITIPPFGSALINVREFFPGCFDQSSRVQTASVSIFPKTGKTYCASLMVREKKTGIFMLEHVLPLPKFPEEY